MGLGLPQVGSVSPAEAQFMVQEAGKRRLTDPMGMDVAQQLMPPQAGESQATMTTRAMLARMRNADIPGLLGHIVTAQGGLPGFGTPMSLEDLTLNLPDEPGAVPSAPAAPPGPAPGATGTPPPSPQLQQLGETPSTVSAARVPAPRAEAPTAPSTAAMATTQAQAQPQPQPQPQPQAQPQAQAQPVSQGPPIPQPPTLPGPIYKQQVERHPTVLAARQALAQYPDSPKAQATYRDAQAKAYQQLLAERERQIKDVSQNYQNQMTAYKATQEALRAPYGYGQDWDAQIRLENGNVAPGDPRLPEMARAAYPRMQARLEAAKAGETAATTTARLEAEQGHKTGLPIADTRGEKARLIVSQQTGTAIDQRTPEGTARTMLAPGGGAVEITTDQQGQLQDLDLAAQVVQQMQGLHQQVYGPGGVYASLTPDERNGLLNFRDSTMAQLRQDHPEIVQYERFLAEHAPLLTRITEGAKGRLPASFVERTQQGLIQLHSGVSLEAKPPFVKINVPDTRAVAERTLQNYIQLLDRMKGLVLHNPDYHYPGFERYQTAAEAAKGRARPWQPPTEAAQTPADRRREEERHFVYGEQGRPPATVAPAPPPTPKAIPQDQRAVNATLEAMRIPQAPDPGRDPQAFQTFLTTLRAQLARYRPRATPQQLDGYINDMARRMGTTWQQ